MLAGNNGSADPHRHDSAHGAKAGGMTTFSNALLDERIVYFWTNTFGPVKMLDIFCAKRKIFAEYGVTHGLYR